MIITWDEPKRLANLDKHGLDFFSDAVVLPAKSARFKAIGRLDGILVVVLIFAPLGQEAISIISLRRAKTKERSRLDG